LPLFCHLNLSEPQDAAGPVTQRNEIKSAGGDVVYKRRTAVCQMWAVTKRDGR